MNRRKKARQGLKGLPGWMASYADMFTVLMAFFVLLFAMSVIDEELFQQFIDSFNQQRAQDLVIGDMGNIMADGGAGVLPETPPEPPPGYGGDYWTGDLGTPYGDTVGDMYTAFRMYFAMQPPSADEYSPPGPWPYGLVVEQAEHYLRITIPEAGGGLLFASGSATLTSYAMEALNALAPELLRFAEAGHGIIVEGHTDNVPISNERFSSNWALSAHRAAVVVEHLVEGWNIDPRLIQSAGLGEFSPIADNDTPEGQAQNRRVEIRVLTREATGGGGSVSNGWFRIPMQ
jgi:chemotaxis protein MotB